jgi:methionine synthase I (cobalamin-dependent)
MLELDVDIIGACCGSSPDHIRAMREALSGAGVASA